MAKMGILRGLTERFDSVLIHFVAGVPKERHKLQEFFDRTALHTHFYGRENFDILKHYGELFGIIDQKVSTLLTHISLMIAATAVLITEENIIFIKLGLWVLLLFYTVFAVVALRVSRFWIDAFPDAKMIWGEWVHVDGTKDLRREMADGFRQELAFRSITHKFLTNAVSMMTLVAALLLGGAQGYFFIGGLAAKGDQQKTAKSEVQAEKVLSLLRPQGCYCPWPTTAFPSSSPSLLACCGQGDPSARP